MPTTPGHIFAPETDLASSRIKISRLEREIADLQNRLAERKTVMDKAYDQLGDITGDLRRDSALCIMLSEVRASLDDKALPAP